MKDRMEGFISTADKERIQAAVREVEKETSGEIVVMVVPESHDYPMAAVMGGLAFAFPLSVFSASFLGHLFWMGPRDMWLFLGSFAPLFFVFHALVKHVSSLRRFFVRQQDMEEEVKEGAHVQFFKHGLYRTREENGVLIYVSLFERRVWILGDRGINAVIPASFWKEAVDSILSGIRAGRPADGICEAVGKVGDILKNRFPIRCDDKNELADLIVGKTKS
jgi:putative membrane protein